MRRQSRQHILSTQTGEITLFLERLTEATFHEFKGTCCCAVEGQGGERREGFGAGTGVRGVVCGSVFLEGVRGVAVGGTLGTMPVGWLVFFGNDEVAVGTAKVVS